MINRALETTELIIIKLDTAARHSANGHFRSSFISEDLIDFWSVDELQLDLVTSPLATAMPTTLLIVVSLEKVDT